MRTGLRITLCVVLFATSSMPAFSKRNPCSGEIPPEGQLLEYCEAAKVARKSKKSQKTLEAVWWAATTACAVACGAELLPVASGGAVLVCNIANWGATAAGTVEALRNNKDFVKSLTKAGVQIGVTMVGNLASNITMSATNYVIPSACVGTAIAAGRALFKNHSAQTYKGKREEYLKLAAKLNSDATPSLGLETKENDSNSGKNGSFSTQSATAGAGGPKSSETSDCGDGKNASQFLRCAAAIAGSGIPKVFTRPSFVRDFKRATGKDLGRFLNRALKPGGSKRLLSRFSSDGKTEKELERLNKKYAKELGIGADLSSYAQSKSRSAAPRGTDLKFGTQSSKKWNLQGKKKRKMKDAKYGRSYDEVFGDRSLSLFSRVNERYQRIRGRLKSLDWFSPYNRYTAGGPKK